MSEPSKSPKKKFRTGAGVGFASRDRSLTSLDRRTRAGRVLRTVEADLIEHVGGHPTAAELLIIKSASIKACRLALLTERLLTSGELATSAEDHALAWLNSMRLDLSALGLQRRLRDVSPSLSDILARQKGGAE